MVLYSLGEQAALVPQPDCPVDACLLAGDNLPPHLMRLHEDYGYLQMHLECRHTTARIAQRQAIKVVQPGIEHSKALREGSVHLLATPLTRPLPPDVGERLGWPLGS
ncbi:MAG: hypothetical protein OXE50_01305 [Chloroflexi bacterium]|nr:hypothetical protein [Chloroflexota bacterium]